MKNARKENDTWIGDVQPGTLSAEPLNPGKIYLLSKINLQENQAPCSPIKLLNLQYHKA